MLLKRVVEISTASRDELKLWAWETFMDRRAQTVPKRPFDME